MTGASDKTICLVDGSGYIFRAFYALPPMTRPDGTPINAVYGFLNMLMQLVSERKCAHIVVVFDAARRNFRNDIYPAYKQTRKETPPELIPQFPLIRETCTLLNIPQIEMEGYEADDLIATYTQTARNKGWQVQIISADKDLMQLMRDGVRLYDPMKHKELTNDDVLKKFGVLPDKVVDVQSFMGDSTDNVPGAAGIGPKTAAELINQFGSVDGVYENLHQIKSDKRRAGLERDKEQVFISRQLVQLDSEVPVQKELESFVAQMPQEEKLYQFLVENNFKSLMNKMKNWLQKQADFLGSVSGETKQPTLPLQQIIDESSDKQHIDTKEEDLSLFQAPQSDNQSITDDFEVIKTPTVKLITTQKEWDDCYQNILTQKEMFFQIYADTDNQIPSGLAITTNGREANYIPLEPSDNDPTTDLFSFQSTNNDTINYQSFLKQISNLFENKDIHKIGFGLKNQLHYLYQAIGNVSALTNYDDVLIQHYVLNGTNEFKELRDIGYQKLQYDLPTLPEIKKKKGVPTIEISPEQYSTARGPEAVLIRNLYYHFKPQADNNSVYKEIDLPLVPILFEMEIAGILIDKMHLCLLNGQFTQEINQLINQIYELAGEEFNINSPAQIAAILFDKMGLTAGKKNAGGSNSTNVSVLEKLAEEGNDIARLILQYRMFVKLKSTYVDSLLTLADKNNRVHTNFLQTVTNTGRLSSTDPNLQNIPVRTSAGKEIRKAFIARNGYKLVCADYSQIELRLMADVAGVKQLVNSFIHNEDIHTRTASQMFKIPIDEVDSDTRRRAKAINFGIIYGISAFGLSNQLGISRTDAKNYIDSYFEHYPEIKTYMENIENFVKQNGYVSTPFNRKIFIAGIDFPKTRAFAVRAAINAPIQGGAADIIKKAMINIDDALKKTNYDATLLLQVHDELVFEVKDEDVSAVMTLVKEKMENAVQLSIPLIADVRSGNNWKEAH